MDATASPSTPAPDPALQATEAYLRLLTQHDRWLAAYIYSLVGNHADADEILQDCKVAMWKHFASFTPDSNFRAWARAFATNHILNYRRTEKRRPATPLEQQFIEAVAAEIDRESESLDRRAEALQECLRKLPEPHRHIVQWRYYEECSIEEIANRSQRTVEACYRLLSRIRAVLNECVSRHAVAPSV